MKRHEMTIKPLLHRRPGMDAVKVRPDLPYGRQDGTSFDLYLPSDASPDQPRPVVVFVSGYPDPGFEAMLGCKLKQMQVYVDWARLVAASGIIAVTYANREPVRDLRAVLEHLRDDAGALGIDPSRMGLWAASGNVPAALAALMEDGGQGLRAAALCYGYTLDLDDSDAVSRAAQQIHFANPGKGRRVEELPASVPLMVVRAGRDETPGLNATLDRFTSAVIGLDRPLTLHNVAGAPHAFDVLDDRPSTGDAIELVLDFLARHLRARP